MCAVNLKKVNQYVPIIPRSKPRKQHAMFAVPVRILDGLSDMPQCLFYVFGHRRFANG